ncbi:hypothetical protein K6025_01175 [Ehrlichia sp. JZT12]
MLGKSRCSIFSKIKSKCNRDYVFDNLLKIIIRLDAVYLISGCKYSIVCSVI